MKVTLSIAINDGIPMYLVLCLEENIDFSDAAVDALNNLLNELLIAKKINYLEIRRNEFTSTSFPKFLAALLQSENLKSIDILGIRKGQIQNYSIFWQALSARKQLKVLTLQFIPLFVSRNGIETFCEYFLSSLQHLSRLTFTNCTNEESAPYLFKCMRSSLDSSEPEKAVQQFSLLQDLTFMYMCLNDNLLQNTLAGILCFTPELKILDLCANHITIKGLLQLLDMLKDHRNLEAISLHDNNITPKDIDNLDTTIKEQFRDLDSDQLELKKSFFWKKQLPLLLKWDKKGFEQSQPKEFDPWEKRLQERLGIREIVGSKVTFYENGEVILRFEGLGYRDAQMGEIIQEIRKYETETVGVLDLNIKGNQFTHEGLGKLVGFFIDKSALLAKLRNVDFSDNPFGNGGIKWLTTLLKSLIPLKEKKIHELNLENIGLQYIGQVRMPEEFAAFVDALRGCRSFIEILKIGDKGVPVGWLSDIISREPVIPREVSVPEIQAVGQAQSTGTTATVFHPGSANSAGGGLHTQAAFFPAAPAATTPKICSPGVVKTV